MMNNELIMRNIYDHKHPIYRRN